MAAWYKTSPGKCQKWMRQDELRHQHTDYPSESANYDRLHVCISVSEHLSATVLSHLVRSLKLHLQNFFFFNFKFTFKKIKKSFELYISKIII